MKIEKVNDNQIKCTLTREDLADRHLKLSELAYGTDKAKSLFRDMMQQASYEFGFEAEDIPLMIEAIPLSADTIILLITKVEYPEELDTRFSNFSQAGSYDDYDYSSSEAASVPLEGADDILGLYKKIADEKQNAVSENNEPDFIPLEKALQDGFTKTPTETRTTQSAPASETIIDITKLYTFSNIDVIIRLAHVLDSFYNGVNSLYKNEKEHLYFLVIRKSFHTPEDFNKVCNILSEYGRPAKYTTPTEAYYKEHLTTIAEENALQVLGRL